MNLWLDDLFIFTIIVTIFYGIITFIKPKYRCDNIFFSILFMFFIYCVIHIFSNVPRNFIYNLYEFYKICHMSFIHASNVYYFNGLVDTIDYDNLLAEYELNNKTLKAQKDFFIGIEDIKKKHIADIKKVS